MSSSVFLYSIIEINTSYFSLQKYDIVSLPLLPKRTIILIFRTKLHKVVKNY